MTHTLPQTALAALAAAGCRVPVHETPSGGKYYGQPTESAVMEFIAGKLSDRAEVSLHRSPHVWDARGRVAGTTHGCRREFPLHALYALALAVGAVKEGTE